MKKTNQILAYGIFLILCFACDSSSSDDIILDDENPDEQGLNLILTLETEQDQIGDLSNNAMAVFNEYVWSVGGARGGTAVANSDVWRSANAVAWESVRFDAFSERTDHTLTNYDNKLWVIGGRTGSETLGEVWSSEDGFTWNLVTDSPAFIGAVNHDVVIFNNRLYLISRRLDEPDRTSVWSSTDGIDWQLEADNAFSGRDEFKAVVFNDAIYVIGGFEANNAALPIFDEIWMSTNGSDWSLVNTNTVFTPRFSHTATVYNDRVFVAGGLGRMPSLKPLGNLWYSEDMVNWSEFEPFSSDIGLAEHTALTFDDRLWLFFGIEGESITDGVVTGKIFSILEE